MIWYISVRFGIFQYGIIYKISVWFDLWGWVADANVTDHVYTRMSVWCYHLWIFVRQVGHTMSWKPPLRLLPEKPYFRVQCQRGLHPCCESWVMSQLPTDVFVFTGAWMYEISRGVLISDSHSLLIQQLSLITLWNDCAPLLSVCSTAEHGFKGKSPSLNDRESEPYIWVDGKG